MQIAFFQQETGDNRPKDNHDSNDWEHCLTHLRYVLNSSKAQAGLSGSFQILYESSSGFEGPLLTRIRVSGSEMLEYFNRSCSTNTSHARWLIVLCCEEPALNRLDTQGHRACHRPFLRGRTGHQRDTLQRFRPALSTFRSFPLPA